MTICRLALVLCCLGLAAVGHRLHAQAKPEGTAMTPSEMKWGTQGGLALAGMEQVILVGNPSNRPLYAPLEVSRWIQARATLASGLSRGDGPVRGVRDRLRRNLRSGQAENPARRQLLHRAGECSALHRDRGRRRAAGERDGPERASICQSSRQSEITSASRSQCTREAAASLPLHAGDPQKL
jgi:hypothetical protein